MGSSQSTSPIAQRSWVDAEGTAWHRRGSMLDRRSFRRATKRAEFFVLHVYAGDFVLMAKAEADELLAGVDLALSCEPWGTDTFLVAEFRDESRRVLIFVEERC